MHSSLPSRVLILNHPSDDLLLVFSLMSYQEITREQLLASVNRRALDFDFEPQCSVTLSTKNVYVCLTCGKNFQGRAFNSPMHVHAVNSEHRLFMSLTDGRCVVMPDNVDVEMPELDDIRRALFLNDSIDISEE